MPDKGVAIALLTNGGDTFALYRDVYGYLLQELAGVRLPELPAPPASPRRIDASRYVGTYSTEVVDMIVSQDDEGRIWLDQIPKGLFAEMGEQPERIELVAYGDDSLIPLRADRGMYLPHAFVADDGAGPCPLPARGPGHPSGRRPAQGGRPRRGLRSPARHRSRAAVHMTRCPP